GWTARVRGGPSLGRPQLVDGYANGWILRPRRGHVLDIEVRWTPQRRVWAALALSAAGLVLCLLLVLFGSRRGRDGAASWRQSGDDTGENTGENTARGAGLPARIAAPLVAGGAATRGGGVPSGV